MNDKTGTKWRGFIAESKAYMDYPRSGVIKFWIRLPFVAAKFYRYRFDDWLCARKMQRLDS